MERHIQTYLNEKMTGAMTSFLYFQRSPLTNSTSIVYISLTQEARKRENVEDDILIFLKEIPSLEAGIIL